MAETLVVTALPHSADATAPFHLSVYVTHRLTPEAEGAVLADFPVTADWTARVAGAELRLHGFRRRGRPSDIAARLVLDPLQPALWPRVFPPDLAVGGWVVPDHTAVPWRTWPAHRAQQNGLLVHALSMFSSPVTAPAPSASALVGVVLSTLGFPSEGRVRLEDVLDGSLDRAVTERLDDGAGFTEGRTRGGLGVNVGQVLLDAHAARRYYQREEEQRPYVDHPVPGAVLPPVVKPLPDFGRRVASLGDTPALMRALGLVLDVVVDDVADLAGLTAVSAELVLPDLPALPSPRTSCVVAGASFTVPSSSDAWDAGRLKVGDEARFTVLDVDPDATALKVEQFLRNVPRLVVSEGNGDPTSAAPASLRATGFALAEIDRAASLRTRLSGAAAADARLLAGELDPLTLEQVNRGLRLEVWDDVSRTWHSLHWRAPRTTVDGEPVLPEEPEQAFLQGAALTSVEGVPGAPKHAHEVVAGWDGWSLAVAPPGGVVVHEDGDERVHASAPVDPDPVDPVATESRVVPGTLPRLRYGRSYSFRAYAVDLAGNSPPHDVQGPAGAPAPPAPAELEPATALLQARPAGATRLAGAAGSASSAATALRKLRPETTIGPAAQKRRGRARIAAAVETGHAELDQVLATRAAPAAIPAQTRADRVVAAFSGALDGTSSLLERTELRVQPAAFAEVLGSVAAPPQQAALVVTPPRPFLRWDPVLEPVVVPRHPYTDGESQLRLVLRSGVEADGTVVPPAAYAAAVTAAHPELPLVWREDSQRHLAPPKTSQLTAEQHGRFDAGIGSASDAQRRRALATSLREAGTLFDTTVADLDVPGARLPQPGVELHVGPTADPPLHADAADLPRGDAPSTGQYVVHDVDRLVVPYLPDPLAAGLSMVFPDARPGGQLSGLLAVEGTTLRYRGDWPEPTPYRLVLTTGPQLHAQVDDDVLTVAVPPGEQLRFRLSSSLDPATLDLLGLWRSLPTSLAGNPAVREAAADGWLWWLTPSTEVVLVHAVPRPVAAPRFLSLTPTRVAGDTTAALVGAVDVHGPSTGRLDVEAHWTEQHDDPAKPAPETLQVEAVACGTTVSVDEDLVLLWGKEGTLALPDGTVLQQHEAVHAFGDTRHRTVDYTARATTRYREFFPNQVVPTRDDLSIVSQVRRVSVPSSARPGRVAVHDVLPLFRWAESTEGGQPFAVQRTRRSGLRLYLERPWFSSGDGELLAVLVALGTPSTATKASVSGWGSDPVWAQDGPQVENLLPLDGFLHAVGLDDRRTPGRPVGPAAPLALPDGAPVLAVGYEPEFSADRGMWFVDVAFDPGTAFWPFVRLAVARYQPDSLPGLHLGPVAVCEWAQLAPERSLTVARTDETHVKLALSGPVGVPRWGDRRPDRERVDTFAELLGQSRTVRARLERRDPTVGTDLGWQVEAVTVLPVEGVAGTRVTWAGVLEVPDDRPRRPGHDTELRVVVEEEERLPADPSEQGQERTSSRIVYRDGVAL